MKTLRERTGALLFIAGAIRFITPSFMYLNQAIETTVLLGMAYLLIGTLVLCCWQSILYYAFAVPLGGLVMTLFHGLYQPSLLYGVLVTLDVMIVVCAGYLLVERRGEADLRA